ncbi:hypothetical protein K7X08_035334 [Anisodus acutangulus]|uniref:NADP-dependent oxidoreductase domain-containing protein n=1 Tax=Anisodus acutangulus TaxID=402998 RepID=A0A9Q1LKU6_9SOLA|nr:hypothetical protein K7X08_035334 [Anisodus acutangulus]
MAKGKDGPLTVSPMGFGTWAWANQLLWGYQDSMDSEPQRIFNLAVENGINLFDTVFFTASKSITYIRCSNSTSDPVPSPSLLKSLKIPRFWPWQKVKMGPLTVSPMGFGTWAWGNQLLWGYQDSMDSELQRTFNLAVENGINLFDTADSYGTGRLNGQSEKLLGKFIREFPGDKQVKSDI